MRASVASRPIASAGATCIRPTSGSPARLGRIPTFVVALLSALSLGGLYGVIARNTHLAGFTTIDARRVRLDGPEWLPPDWEEWIGVRIAERGGLSSLDSTAIDALVAELEAMPSVLEVGQARVEWPDGLSIELCLRRPVACVRVGTEFLCVSADGVLLPGYRSVPPGTAAGYLPVLGPNDGAFDGATPGGLLREERHLDALSVALSMARHLEPADSIELGPVLVDASRAADASVAEAGTRLYLEDQRLVLFGRPPRAGLPGELPEAAKWAHLSRALSYLHGEPAVDWDLVDLRWDRARLRERGR